MDLLLFMVPSRPSQLSFLLFSIPLLISLSLHTTHIRFVINEGARQAAESHIMSQVPVSYLFLFFWRRERLSTKMGTYASSSEHVWGLFLPLS